jgi:hypothetical protein
MAWRGLGAGSSGDPYQIATLAQLQEVKDYLSSYFLLMNDIDASATETWNYDITSNTFFGFEPIGAYNATPFTGSFDGGGFTISNLYINRTTDTGHGFFGYVGGTAKEIKNLTIKDANITTDYYAGILAAYLHGTMTVTNVHVSGIITATGNGQVGGLAGWNTTSIFSTCSASVSIMRSGIPLNQTAGFAAYVSGSTFTSCWTEGSISVSGTATSGNPVTGGFVATTYTSPCTFTSCYSNVSIIDTVVRESPVITILGGFIGKETAGSGFSLCHSSGSVISDCNTYQVYAGGFVGYMQAGNTLYQSAALGIVKIIGQCSVDSYVGGFVGLQSSAVAISNCYAQGDVCENINYPLNKSIGGFSGYTSTGTLLTNCYSTGYVNPNGISGGFIGQKAAGTVTACHWDKESSGLLLGVGSGTLTGLTGNTTAEMQEILTFTGWDFSTVWQSTSGTQSSIHASNLTVWLSETGAYETFEAGVKDADSFQLTIPSTNEIRWIESMDSLVIGTAGDEWKIGSNRLGTPITPTNFGVKRQTNYGSALMQAIRVNEVILFVDYVRRKIREMTYDVSAEKFTCPDMSLLAEHITQGQIKWMAYQRNPDSILWVGLITGEVKIFVYDREQNVTAWANVPLGGDGLAQSGCVIPGATEDVVYLAVSRTLPGEEVYYGTEPVYYGDEPVIYGGGDKVYIEKFSARLFTAIEDCHFVDCGIVFETSGAWVDEPVLYGTEPVYYGTEPVVYSVFDTTAPTSTITGLDHLNGETVKVLGDGVVLDDEVVSDGKITPHLNGIVTPVLKAHVGLAYTSILQPMRIVLDSMGANTHVGNMVVSLMNTGAAKTGVKLADLKDVNLSDPRWTNLSTITGLFTGECRVSNGGNFDPLNPIFISTDKPVPMTVRCMVPDIERTGK